MASGSETSIEKVLMSNLLPLPETEEEIAAYKEHDTTKTTFLARRQGVSTAEVDASTLSAQLREWLCRIPIDKLDKAFSTVSKSSSSCHCQALPGLSTSDTSPEDFADSSTSSESTEASTDSSTATPDTQDCCPSEEDIHEQPDPKTFTFSVEGKKFVLPLSKVSEFLDQFLAYTGGDFSFVYTSLDVTPSDYLLRGFVAPKTAEHPAETNPDPDSEKTARYNPQARKKSQSLPPATALKLALRVYLQRETFSNSFFKVRKSELGGLGAFATRNIRRGEVILIEEPLLHYHVIGTEPFNTLWNLSEEKQALFRSLHRPKKESSRSTVIIEDIASANAFETGNYGRIIMVAASRFNHACKGQCNVTYCYDKRRDALVMTTLKRIDAGEELLINYGGNRADLYTRYGFWCNCGSCSPGVKENIRW